MIKQIDEEMRKQRVGGIVVYGDTTLANPSLTYVVGGTLARGGIYFKRAGDNPLLVTSNLDIGTAKRLGRVRRIQTYTQWGFEKLAEKYHHRDEAFAHLIATVLRHEGFSGRVALFGRNDVASGIQLVDILRKMGLRIVGQRSPSIVDAARETKDKAELGEISRVGKRTAIIVEEIAGILRKTRRKRGHLQIGKKRATIRLVKTIISSKLAAQGLIAPEGTIFAIGPSGSDPHNMGVSTEKLKEGRLIVFDIFPQAETGYWFDLTRTFMIGKADAKAKRVFETVHAAQGAALDILRAGITGEAAMSAACDVVERAGYRTMRDLYEDKVNNLKSGFNHSLGHGVGLTIGERPYLSLRNKDRLKKNHVVTVEPGVYLPRYGGVRIEDTVLITPRGFRHLANLETELELA